MNESTEFRVRVLPFVNYSNDSIQNILMGSNFDANIIVKKIGKLMKIQVRIGRSSNIHQASYR